MQTFLKQQIPKDAGNELFLSMKEEIFKQNLLSPNPMRAAAKAAVLGATLFYILFLAWESDSAVAVFMWSLAAALLLAQFAFLGHDAGHAAISTKGILNRSFGQICMTLVTGLAFQEWSQRHRAHHEFCQLEDKDPDMQVNFVVSLTEQAYQKKSGLGKKLTQIQFWTMPLLSLLFGHSQRHLSQVAALMNPIRFKADCVVLLLHFTLWFVLPMAVLNVTFGQALLVYLLPVTFLGPYLAAIFWVNHIGMPTVQSLQSFSFVEHQVRTSRNIKAPFSMNWIFGGLNQQIEHHLFPKVPSGRLNALQPIVKKHLERNQMTYQELSWIDAGKAIFCHLKWVSSR